MEIILVISTNLLFLALGFKAGMLKAGQALPSLGKKTDKDQSYEDIDPYTKAMIEPEPERKETV